MKLQYWGTAAAEGIPAVFCNCATCQAARQKGGRDIRTRSQMMLDDTLLIDFGPDTYMHALQYGANLSQLEHVLITHVHGDHFTPREFSNRREGFAHNVNVPLLTLHGSEDMRKAFIDSWNGDATWVDSCRVTFDEMTPFAVGQVGTYTVTPLPASHGTAHPYVYAIQKDGKNFLLLNDTGYLKPEVFAWLKTCGIVFDAVSYECTFGLADRGRPWDGGAHMNFDTARLTRERLEEYGCADRHTRHLLTHFTHNGTDIAYETVCAYVEPLGFTVAYDGLTIEF